MHYAVLSKIDCTISKLRALFPELTGKRCTHCPLSLSDCPASRAGEMIPEVEGTRPWGPSRKRVPKCIKGPKTTDATIAVTEKQSKRSKSAHFRYILGPPGPTQEMELMRPGGEGPSRFTPVSPAMPASTIHIVRRLSTIPHELRLTVISFCNYITHFVAKKCCRVSLVHSSAF